MSSSLNRPILEQALTTLIPTYTHKHNDIDSDGSSFLPAELISLAGSLLAHSRSKAASLKAEEEIARTYACAHLACERLVIDVCEYVYTHIYVYICMCWCWCLCW